MISIFLCVCVPMCVCVSISSMCVCLYRLCAYVFLGGVLKVFFFERGCPKMRNSGLKDG